MTDVMLRLRIEGQQIVVSGIDGVKNAVDRNTQAQQKSNQAATDGARAAAQTVSAARTQAAALDALGVSAKQTAAAMRNVPAQFTDIVTQLQGGANPLTVLMQQGGQLKDMFGGVGAASRALGGYVASLVTPFSVGAAAAAGLGYAAYKGAQESDELARALVMTGNQAGTTAGQLQDSARRVAQGVGTQSQAVEALSGLISAGVGRGAVNLEALTAAAIKLERNGGPAVSSTIKLFAALGEDPVAALKKLSDATGQVEPVVYAQVMALVKLGDTAKAAALAQQEGARITDEQAKALLPTLGWVEQAWQAIADAAGKAKDKVLDLGRQETDAQASERTRNVLALKRASLEAAIAAGDGESRYANILRSEIGAYEAAATAQAKSAARKMDAAAAEGIAAAQRRKSVDAEKDWKAIAEQNLSLEKKFAEERERIERIGKDKGANAQAVADQVAAARRRILGPREDAIAQQNAQYEVSLRKLTDSELVASTKHRVQLQLQTEESAIKQIAEIERTAALDRAATLDKLAKSEQDPVKRLKARQDAALARQEAASTAAKAERDLAELAYKADRAVVDAANNAVASEIQRRQALEESTRAIGIQTAQARQHGIVIDSVATILDREKTAIYDTALAQAEANLQTQRSLGLAAEQLKGYEDAVALLTRMRDGLKEVTAASEANDLAKAGLDQTKRLTGVSDPTAPMTDFGNTLRDALGGASSSMGQMVNTMTTLNRLALEYKREMGLIEELRSRGNEKDQVTAAQNEILLIKKQEQAQVGAYANMAGAAASYFGKQTAAYKILHGAEVALRTYQLVLSAQTAAKDLAAIGARVAAFVTGETVMTGAATTGSAARAVASQVEGQAAAVAGVATQAKGDPYTAFFRIAAMTAIMAGLGFLVGGGSKGPGPAPTNTGTGTVFGDTNAKSESINKSLDTLNATQDVALQYSRAMAASLRSIEASMGGVTNIWLRTGGAAGLTSGIATGKMDTGLSSFMSFGKELLGPLSGAFGDLMTSLFGKKISITGSGLTADAQSLGSILGGGYQGYNYADVQTKRKFLGFTTSTRTSERRTDLDPALEQQITGIFTGIGSAVSTAADLLGQDMTGVQQRLQGYVVDIGRIDLKDLDGKQIAERLSAVFGQQADLIAQSVIPGFESLTRVGEGYFETLSRVANEFEVVSTYTRRLGGVMGATGLDAARLSDSLVGLFGGVDGFTTALSDYYQAFYSDAERTAMTTAELQTAFGRLNLSMPASEQAFRDLVNAQDKTTDAGRSAFAALIQLAPAFRQVTAASEQAAQALADAASKVADQRASLQSQLDQAMGNTAAIRARELAALDPSNRALQQRIYLLDDEKAALAAAKTNTDTALSALQRALDAQKTAASLAKQVATEQVASIKSVLGVIEGGIKDLVGGSAQSTAAAQAYIDQALATARATGYLPDSTGLSDAISTVKADMASRVYTSAAAQQADKLALAARLTDLKILGGEQLGSAEKALRTAQDQLTSLDSIYTQSKAQLDALRGVDSSVKTVAEAVNLLNASMASELRAMAAASAAGAASSTTGGSTNAYQPYSTSDTPAVRQAKVEAQTGVKVSATDSPLVQAAKVLYQSTHGGASSAEYNAAAALVGGDIGKALGWNGSLEDTERLRRVYGFANGGYYPGGLAMVGEQGPELINFDRPGQVYTASQTQNILGGNSRALEALVAEVKRLQAIVTEGNRQARRTADATNGNPEQPMLVETV